MGQFGYTKDDTQITVFKMVKENLITIKEGEVLQLHCPLRGTEKRYPQVDFEDFYDTYLLKLVEGDLYIMMAWKNELGVYEAAFMGNSKWSKITPEELGDFGFTKVNPNPQNAEYYKQN